MLKVDSLWSLLDQTTEPSAENFEDSSLAPLGWQLNFPLESATSSQYTYLTNVAAMGFAESAAIQQTVLASDFQVHRDDLETSNNSEPTSTQGASEIVSIAEGYLAQNAVWGDENCTGFVFTVSMDAGLPYFYGPNGHLDQYGNDLDTDEGAYGDQPNLGYINDTAFPSHSIYFYTPVQGPGDGGTFSVSELDKVKAYPDIYDSNWKLVDGNSSNFTIFNDSVVADQPQPGDIFRGVVEQKGEDGDGGSLILHSGIVESYDANTETVWLISNYPLAPDGSYDPNHITLVQFQLISGYQDYSSNIERIITTYSTFYRLNDVGPEGLTGSITAQPSSGDYKAGDTITLALQANEAVSISGGTPALLLNDNEAATYSSGSGTDVLNFVYTVQPGDNIANLAVTGFNSEGASVTDSFGNPVSLSDITATFSGLQIDTTPPTAPAPSLTVNTTAGPTPIGIGTPTDSAGVPLTITVSALPGDGTVYLSDGSTAVTIGEPLMADQLNGLEFKPSATSNAECSFFSYTVTDAAGNSTIANVALSVNAGGTISGTINGTDTIAAGTTEVINSPVYLQYVNFGTPTNAILENYGSLFVQPGGSIAGDGTEGGGVIGGNGQPGDTVINEQGGTLYIDAPTTFSEMIPFENYGTLAVSAGAGNVAEISSPNGYLGGAFVNYLTGTVQVSSGTLDIDNGGTSSASAFTVNAGATLLFTGVTDFTFSGGTYNVAGTTEVGSSAINEVANLIFATGTVVNAGNAWVIDSANGYYADVDMSAATLEGQFTNLQINTPDGSGASRLFLGNNNTTISGLVAYNGITIETTGAVTLTGTNSISNTLYAGEASVFDAATLNNYGSLTLNSEDIGNIGTFNNFSTVTATNGGIDGTTINNESGATMSFAGGGVDEIAINNYGTMVLDGTSSAVSITGLLTNYGTVVESGAVYFEGGFVNYGTIEGSDTVSGDVAAITMKAGIANPGSGEEAGNGGSASVTNLGTVEAYVGLVVDPEDTDNITVTDSSVFVGTSGTAIEFGVGNDRLVVDPSATIIGTVDGGSGTNTIELAAGTGSGSLSGLGTNFTDFQQLIIDPGAVWQLSGTAPSQLPTNNDGAISVGAASLVLGSVESDSGQTGTISISDGGSVEFQSSVSASQTIMILTGGASVRFDDPQQFDAVLDVVGTTVTGATIDNGIISVSHGSTMLATLDLSNTLEASDIGLFVASDGSKGSFLTLVGQSMAASSGTIYFSNDTDITIASGNISTNSWSLTGTNISVSASQSGITVSDGVKVTIKGSMDNLTLGSDDTVTILGDDEAIFSDGNHSVINLGATFGAGDEIQGGPGSTEVILDGNYTGSSAVNLSADTLVDIQELYLHPGYSYDLTLNAATIAAGQMFVVNAAHLGASDDLAFDAYAKTTGTLEIDAGGGTNTIDLGSGRAIVRGGTGSEKISFTGGFMTSDEIAGGSGGANEVILDGNYTGANAVKLGDKTLTDIQELYLHQGFNYDLILNAATVASAQEFVVDAAHLGASDDLTLNAYAQWAGTLEIDAGGGINKIDLGSGRAIVLGSTGSETISFAGGFTATDEIAGGSGGANEVILDGNYTGADSVKLSGKTLTNIQNLYLHPGYSYDLTLDAATIASGQKFTVDAAHLGAGDDLTFDAYAQTAGTLVVDAGGGGQYDRSRLWPCHSCWKHGQRDDQLRRRLYGSRHDHRRHRDQRGQPRRQLHGRRRGDDGREDTDECPGDLSASGLQLRPDAQRGDRGGRSISESRCRPLERKRQPDARWRRRYRRPARLLRGRNEHRYRRDEQRHALRRIRYRHFRLYRGRSINEHDVRQHHRDKLQYRAFSIGLCGECYRYGNHVRSTFDKQF